MTDMQKILAYGLFINSALYLVGVFVAGMRFHNDFAWKMALASAGFTYVGYMVQFLELPRAVSGTAVTFSVVLGLAAGLALLWKS